MAPQGSDYGLCVMFWTLGDVMFILHVPDAKLHCKLAAICFFGYGGELERLQYRGCKEPVILCSYGYPI